MKPLITILTPTYNRANLLSRVFNSLQDQTNKNFEWIIVDDGSADNTKEIIKKFISNSFSIHYYYKKNGGKHTALNYGVHKAKGKYILMLDSDDFLPTNAVEIITNKIKDLPTHLGGVVGRKSDFSGKIVGSKGNFKAIISNSLDIRYKYGIEGDLTEVYKTTVIREHLFPEFEDEKFCPEILVWNRIAEKYNLLFVNESIYIADYQSNGLTDKIVQIRMNSPKATMLTYSELANYNIPLKEKLKATINFWRFSFNDKDWSFYKKLKMSNVPLFPIAFTLGFAMHLMDKRKTT